MQAPKTTYQYAKFYQSKGLVPLPLVPKGKFPSVEGWQQRNLNSEITAKAFAAKNNIGILCGEVSGIFVLDIDNKDRGVEIYNRLLLERGIAENDLTLVATTGSGGKHLFFKYNPQYGTSTGVIKFGGEPVGWDIRSNGGQVVVEPSEHPETKRQYKFEGDLETIVGRIQYLPMWLEDILDCGGVVDFEGRLVADYERAIEEENRRAQAPVERRAEYPPMAPNAYKIFRIARTTPLERLHYVG
jgi:hypothetical protein